MPNIMAESSIISHKIVEDSEFLFHASKHTNIQKSIAAHENYIQHETEWIRSLQLLQLLKFSTPYSLEDLSYMALKFVSMKNSI